MTEAKEEKAVAKKAAKNKKAAEKVFGPFVGATEIVGPDGKTYTIPAGVEATFKEKKVWVMSKNKV